MRWNDPGQHKSWQAVRANGFPRKHHLGADQSFNGLPSENQAVPFPLCASNVVPHPSRDNIGSGTAVPSFNTERVPIPVQPVVLRTHCHSTAQEWTNALKSSIDVQQISSGNRTFQRRALHTSNKSPILPRVPIPTASGWGGNSKGGKKFRTCRVCSFSLPLY
jgi:hypothetical protein